MIIIRGVWKIYGKTVALAGVSLEIDSPGLYLFYGPNGSGKSTLLSLILGIIRPTRGNVRVFGLDPYRNVHKLSKRVASAFEGATPPGHLPGVEVARVLSKARGVEWGTVTNYAETLGVKEYWDRSVYTYSMGMKKKLLLALAFASATMADLLVLDEPYTQLDANSIGIVSELIRDLSEEIPVLVASHIITDAEESARRAYLMANGRIKNVVEREYTRVYSCPIDVIQGKRECLQVKGEKILIDYRNGRVVVVDPPDDINLYQGCIRILSKEVLDDILGRGSPYNN